jgi:membrane protein required for colicin V production
VTSFDWILVTIVVASTITGLMAGFARVTIGLAAGIFGILFGFWFYRMPAAWFGEYFESKTAASVLGFLTIFALIVIVGGLLSRLMSKLFKWAGLSWLDRLMGGAFGFLRGMIVATGIIIVITAFSPNPPPRWIANSQMMPYVTGFSKILAAVAPREMKEKFDENLDRIVKLWDDRGKPSASNSRPANPDLKKQTY